VKFEFNPPSGECDSSEKREQNDSTVPLAEGPEGIVADAASGRAGAI